jgi:hypothetical protein
MQVQQRSSARDCSADCTHTLRFCHERLRRSAGHMKDPASKSGRPPDAEPCRFSAREGGCRYLPGRLSARLMPVPT